MSSIGRAWWEEEVPSVRSVGANKLDQPFTSSSLARVSVDDFLQSTSLMNQDFQNMTGYMPR